MSTRKKRARPPREHQVFRTFGASRGPVLDDPEVARERQAAREADKARCLQKYMEFAAQNGGRLGDDLAGILAGTVQPSGEPFPETRLADCGAAVKRPPCSHCQQRRATRDDGLCTRCRIALAPKAEAPPCRLCTKHRATPGRADGLCCHCRGKIRHRQRGQERRDQRRRGHALACPDCGRQGHLGDGTTWVYGVCQREEGGRLKHDGIVCGECWERRRLASRQDSAARDAAAEAATDGPREGRRHEGAADSTGRGRRPPAGEGIP